MHAESLTLAMSLLLACLITPGQKAIMHRTWWIIRMNHRIKKKREAGPKILHILKIASSVNTVGFHMHQYYFRRESLLTPGDTFHHPLSVSPRMQILYIHGVAPNVHCV